MLAESGRAISKHFSTNVHIWTAAILSFSLVGCGGSKQQSVPAHEAAPTATQPPKTVAPQYTVQELPGSVVEGRVLLQGGVPPPKKIQVTQDIEACGKTREVYPVRVENGGVDDAVVWIDDITSGKPFNFPGPVIEQKKCLFTPHVLLMKPGQLRVTNTDLCLHNVHVFARVNREPNKAIPPGAGPIEIALARPDLVTIRCDVHAWMRSYVIVAKNPYYVVTGTGGRFRLDGVPAGHYHLKVWQESLGELDQEITVEAGKPTKADFTLKSQAAQGSGAN